MKILPLAKGKKEKAFRACNKLLLRNPYSDDYLAKSLTIWHIGMEEVE